MAMRSPPCSLAVAASSSSSSVLPSRVCSAHWCHHGPIRLPARPLFGAPKPTSSSRVLLLLRSPAGPPFGSSAVAFSRRRRSGSSGTTSKHKRTFDNDEAEGGDDMDEDAFEALFQQLEEDLKNDGSVDDSDDEVSEEDMAKLEQELAEAFGDADFEEESAENSFSESEDSDNDEDTEEIEQPKLKNWQLRRLAHALKAGRRKTGIKNLAAELGLDRAFVLDLLRDPPPNLLLMSATLLDEVAEVPSEHEGEPIEAPLPAVDKIDAPESEPQEKLPVHVMRTRWSAQKRLKKVQVETLERVYFRTKRPTNAMISSIVHVTNLPWKRVVKWFDDRRLQDGVPEERVPYRRPLSETVSSS